jgi:hypothetical protein
MIRRPNKHGKNRRQRGPAATVSRNNLSVVSATRVDATHVEVVFSLPFVLSANPGEDATRPWTFTKAASPDVAITGAVWVNATALRLTAASTVDATYRLSVPEWSPGVRGYMAGYVLPGAYPITLPT